MVERIGQNNDGSLNSLHPGVVSSTMGPDSQIEEDLDPGFAGLISILRNPEAWAQENSKAWVPDESLARVKVRLMKRVYEDKAQQGLVSEQIVGYLPFKDEAES